MSGTARDALARALALSQQLLAAVDESKLAEVATLDEERLRLLQSVRSLRDSLSDGDRLMLRQVCELNDRAIGLVEHQRRIKERAMDLAAVGRRAVSAYSTTRSQR
jgi:hypothetical protein